MVEEAERKYMEVAREVELHRRCLTIEEREHVESLVQANLDADALVSALCIRHSYYCALKRLNRATCEYVRLMKKKEK